MALFTNKGAKVEVVVELGCGRCSGSPAQWVGASVSSGRAGSPWVSVGSEARLVVCTGKLYFFILFELELSTLLVVTPVKVLWPVSGLPVLPQGS